MSSIRPVSSPHLLAWAKEIMASRPPNGVMGNAKAWNVHNEPGKWVLNIHLWDGIDTNGVRHDHIHDSVSLCLEGSMIEEYGIPPETHRRLIQPGDIVFRAAEFAHMIPANEDAKCITLFLAGPAIRKMGFYCPQGWTETLVRGPGVCLGTSHLTPSTEPTT
jgi:hypothetical protein